MNLMIVLSNESFVQRLGLVVDGLGYNGENNIPSISILAGKTMQDLQSIAQWNLIDHATVDEMGNRGRRMNDLGHLKCKFLLLSCL
jgi:hypothetical protein